VAAANLLDPFPGKPAGMHRQTYYRLFAKGLTEDAHLLGLEIEDICRRFPSFLRQDSRFSPLWRQLPWQLVMANSSRSGRLWLRMVAAQLYPEDVRGIREAEPQ